jgi:PAS domain S-box-containing protein
MDSSLSWQPALLWLHAVSDTATGVAYFAIPIGLAALVMRRHDLMFGWMFWLFGLFILACGTTHFMDVWVLWHPKDYGVQGLLKAFTAVVSILTAVLLWKIVPRLRSLPTAAQYRRVKERLSAETSRHERTVEQLRRSEESFRLLVQSVRDYAMFMLDAGGVVTSWNAGAEHIKGYEAGEIIGRHFSCFYTPEDQARGKPARALETAVREGQFHDEGWRMRKDGTPFMAEVAINPMLDRNGKVVGFAKVTRDVTERVRTEAALDQARATLAQSQKMEAVGQLTGGIAHDFNNMLTAILGSLELLEIRQEVFSTRAARMLQVIRHAADHGAELTRRLLAFSRKQSLAPAVVDVNGLVAGMSELIRRTLGESISIETALAENVWPAFVDANQVESALLNLAVNARDAMPDGGRLRIETGNALLDEAYARVRGDVAAGEYVIIAVSDTGTGMAPEVAEHAFEPFYTTKGVDRGTGLGLSQVYGFVKQSEGHVELSSEVGHGTMITMYLPRHVAQRGMAPLDLSGLSGPLPGGSETILVVEDDDDVRNYSVSAGRHLGYDMLEARTAGEALALIARRPDIALLFTDVGLPGVNGRDLATAALQQLPQLKVVYTSAHPRATVASLGLVEAAAPWLAKPFRIQALARMLRSALDRT